MKFRFDHFRQYFLTAVFFTLSAFIPWVRIHSFELEQVKNGIIGIATIDAIDVGKRVALFYQSLLLIVFLFSLIVFLLELLHRFSPLPAFTKVAGYFSFFGIICLVFYCFGVQDNFILGILLITTVLFLFASIYARSWDISSVSTDQIAFQILSSFLSGLLLLILFHPQEPAHSWILFITGYIVAWLLTGYYFYRENAEIISKHLWKWRPLAFLPALPLISNELYLIFNQHGLSILSPIAFFYIFLILISVVILLRSLVVSGNKKFPSLSKQLDSYYLPVLIACLTILFSYNPFQTQSKDLFELANPANAVMRFVKFNEIPIFQAYSSHLLSEQVFPFLTP